MAPDWLFIPILFTTGAGTLLVVWGLLRWRAHSPEGFASTAYGLWIGVAQLAGAGVLLACKLSGVFNRVAMMFATVIVMFAMLVAYIVAIPFQMRARRWYGWGTNRFP